MILPTRKLVLLLLAPAAVLMVFPSTALAMAVAGYDIGLLAVALLDLSISARPGQLDVQRRLPEHLSLGADNRVGWEVHNASAQDLELHLTEDLPQEIESGDLPITARLLAEARATLHHTVRPHQRGQHRFGDIHLRYRTRLGLLRRQRRIRTDDAVKVYPNAAALARYELAAQRRRLGDLGLISTRQLGRGGVFESLREYVPGDDLADVAWKTTAKRGHLITRNFEADRSQNILLVLDCGRLMTSQMAEGLTRLDHAINACLLLTHVAVKQGDYVGLVAFSDRIESYMPLRKGRAALGRMNESLYRLEPRLCEPNYEGACRFLSLQQRKRSLIVILTEVVDPEASGMLLTYAARFARSHLPLVVTMRNTELEGIVAEEPHGAEDCFRKAMSLNVLEARRKALESMRLRGVDVLDTIPDHLTPNLIERYLSLKQRRRL